MTKKYELVQWYPSLKNKVEVGDIVSIPERNEVYYYTDGITKIGNGVHKSEVENNPNFWKEVEEKTYEILSFKVNNKIYTSINANEYMNGLFVYNIEYFLGLPADIYSIRRLSDGEVFTIGDVVENKNHGVVGKITKFSIYGKSIRVDYNGWDRLEHIIKVKQALFTTEDGVDIFKGDYYWVVSTQNNKPIGGITRVSVSIPASNWKTFSTTKKAEKWIEDNISRYSRKEIADAYAELDQRVIFGTPFGRVNLSSLLNKLDNE